MGSTNLLCKANASHAPDLLVRQHRRMRLVTAENRMPTLPGELRQVLPLGEDDQSSPYEEAVRAIHLRANSSFELAILNAHN